MRTPTAARGVEQAACGVAACRLGCSAPSRRRRRAAPRLHPPLSSAGCGCIMWRMTSSLEGSTTRPHGTSLTWNSARAGGGGQGQGQCCGRAGRSTAGPGGAGQGTATRTGRAVVKQPAPAPGPAPRAPSTNQPPSEEMRARRMLRPSSVRHCTTCTPTASLLRQTGRDAPGWGGGAGAPAATRVMRGATCCCCCSAPPAAGAPHLHQRAGPVGRVNGQHGVVLIGLIVNLRRMGGCSPADRRGGG